MLDFRFRTWLEAHPMRPIVDVGINPDQEKAQEFHARAKDFIKFYKSLNLQNNNGQLSEQQIKDIYHKILSVKVALSGSNSVSRSIFQNKQVLVPHSLETTFAYIKELNGMFQQLSKIVAPYVNSNETASRMVAAINGFVKDVNDIQHSYNAAYQGYGNRYTGEFQNQANQISSNVRDVVLKLLKTSLTQLGKKDHELQDTIRSYWELVKKTLSKPIAFSALEKQKKIQEAMKFSNDKDKEEVHSKFIQGLQNLKSLLQTPRLWKDDRYVTNAFRDVFIHSADRYPELFSDESGYYPYKMEQTVKYMTPVIKLLPNIYQFYRNHPNVGNIMHYVKKLNAMWETLKGSFSAYQNQKKGNLALSDIHYTEEIEKQVLPQINKYILSNIDTLFPNMGKNKNNYIKAINFYMNRLQGILSML